MPLEPPPSLLTSKGGRLPINSEKAWGGGRLLEPPGPPWRLLSKDLRSCKTENGVYYNVLL